MTLLVAAAVGAAVLAAGFAVQAAALPAPHRGALVLARAASWLNRYRFVESAFTVEGHRTVRGRCLEGWFPAGGTELRRGTVLHFGRTGTIASLDGRPLQIAGIAPNARLAVLRLELAGCPRLLGPAIASFAQSLPDVRVERVTVAGRPAIGFALPLQHGRLEVYVTPLTNKPIALHLTNRFLDGRSLIRLAPLTPALRAAFARR